MKKEPAQYGVQQYFSAAAIAFMITHYKNDLSVKNTIKHCAHKNKAGFCARSNRQCPATNFQLTFNN